MPCKEEFDVNQIRYEEGFFICAGHDAHGSRININRLQVEYDYPKQHITPRLLKFLADSYEYDCEGECLATWKFFYEGGGDVGEFKSRQITARDGITASRNQAGERYFRLLPSRPSGERTSGTDRTRILR